MLVVGSLMFIYTSARTSSANEYFMGISTVVLYMNTIHRKPFTITLIGTLGCIAVFLFGMQFVTVTNEAARVPAIMCSVGISAVSLLAAYRIEQVDRRDYLASLREKVLVQQIQVANQELKQLSITDQLTGIRNRRSFDEAAARSCGDGRARALILIDVDYFKNFNDIEGHLAGDECLCRTAKCLRDALRRDDDRNFVARYGGEEFVVLLDNCGRSAALAVGQRLLSAVEAEAIPHRGRPDGRGIVTISIGIAVSADGTDLIDNMVKRADFALYDAKRRGRGRLVFASNAHEESLTSPDLGAEQN